MFGLFFVLEPGQIIGSWWYLWPMCKAMGHPRFPRQIRRLCGISFQKTFEGAQTDGTYREICGVSCIQRYDQPGSNIHILLEWAISQFRPLRLVEVVLLLYRGSFAAEAAPTKILIACLSSSRAGNAMQVAGRVRLDSPPKKGWPVRPRTLSLVRLIVGE